MPGLASFCILSSMDKTGFPQSGIFGKNSSHLLVSEILEACDVYTKLFYPHRKGIFPWYREDRTLEVPSLHHKVVLVYPVKQFYPVTESKILFSALIYDQDLQPIAITLPFLSHQFSISLLKIHLWNYYFCFFEGLFVFVTNPCLHFELLTLAFLRGQCWPFSSGILRPSLGPLCTWCQPQVLI